MPGPRRPHEPMRLDCHERALRLLTVRPRSRRELRERLLRAGFSVEEVEAELERLQEVGLVDDERFARTVAEHEVVGRRAGARAVRSALLAKGVDRATVEAVLAELPGGDEEGRAVELARTRVGRLRGLPANQAFGRLAGFLERRGYPPDVARRAARAVLALEPD